MTDLNIDKLENEAMAMIYDASKPDELNEAPKEISTEVVDTSFFKISQLFNNKNITDEKRFYQCFRYIKMMDCDWDCHYLLLLNYKVGMLIPKQYIMIYDESSKNDLNRGKIKFRNDKEYLIEYHISTKEEFLLQMSELEVVSECVEKFENNNQMFYEFNNGQIYMYYEGYTWTITGYSRNHIKEYYDMYIILMSVRKQENKEYIDKDNLKLLYLISKNALNYLYKGIDLKKKTLEEIKEYSLSEDVVTFSIDNSRYLTVIDEDYQMYNRKIREINEEISKLNISHNDIWSFEGTFKTGILGTYTSGHLLDFPEIVNSSELSEIEKRKMLENIVNQKQIELYEYKDYIANKLLNNLINDLKDTLTIDKWNELELINYLYVEDIDIENKTEELLYDHFKYALDNDDFELVKSLIDTEYLANSVKTNNVAIGPEFMAFACTILGKNRTYILFENNEFIEWK